MAGVFLSYRRSDAKATAGRLYESLSKRLPRGTVFRDIDQMPLRVKFADYIRDSVTASDAVIALIGPSWLTAPDDEGKRRLDDPSDFVRLEIETALERGIPIIPTLVDGAVMPSKKALPEAVQALCDWQNFEIVDRMWEESCDRLASAIRPTIEAGDSWWHKRRAFLVGSGAALVLIVIGSIALPWRNWLPAHERPIESKHVTAGSPVPVEAAAETSPASVPPLVPAKAPSLLDVKLVGQWQLDAAKSFDEKGNQLNPDRPVFIRIAELALGELRLYEGNSSQMRDAGEIRVAEKSMVFSAQKGPELSFRRVGASNRSTAWAVELVERQQGAPAAQGGPSVVARGKAQLIDNGSEWKAEVSLNSTDGKERRMAVFAVVQKDGRTGEGKAWDADRLLGTLAFKKVSE